MKKTSFSNLDYPSESMKSNEIDEKRLQTQHDITPDDEEEAKERLRASDIQQDFQAIAQDMAKVEETLNEIHSVDVSPVLKSPTSFERSKIVLTEGKNKFSLLEKWYISTNFGMQFLTFFQISHLKSHQFSEKILKNNGF